MGLISKLSNYSYLLRIRNKPLKFEERSRAYLWINNAFRIGKEYKKGRFIRNQIAKHIRSLHNQHPYKIQDYSKARKMYDDYPLLPFSIDYKEMRERVKKGEEVFITYFRDEYPVKGERYESYFIDGCCCKVGEVTRLVWNKEEERIQEHHYNTKLGFYLDQNSIKMCRYSFEEEIKKYWERKNQYDYLSGCKALVFQELERINNEIAEI